jgi:hypothetical protein
MSNDVYLGNPLLKKANTPIEFTQEQILEFVKCKDDPVYFANNYVKIVTLDHGLQTFKPYHFQEKLINNFHNHRFNICKMPRQTGKCFNINTTVRLRNKLTGEIIEVTIGEFYEKIKKESNTDLP